MELETLESKRLKGTKDLDFKNSRLESLKLSTLRLWVSILVLVSLIPKRFRVCVLKELFFE